MFKWHDLIYFLELSRQGRLGPTARRLSVDHATVSRRVGELEKALTVKLFNRHQDGFKLTEAGNQLLRLAETIEQNVHEIEEVIGGSTSNMGGNVRLASMEGIAAFYLSSRLTKFREDCPEVLVELTTERRLVDLTKREADLLLSFIPAVGARVQCRQIGEFRLGLFASDEYLSTHGIPLSTDDLHNHYFVDYVEDLIDIHPVHWLIEVISPEQVSFRSSSMAAQQLAVATGMGIALLPYFSAKTDPRLRQVLPLDVVVTRQLYLSIHEEQGVVGRVRALQKFLTKLFVSDWAYLNEY